MTSVLHPFVTSSGCRLAYEETEVGALPIVLVEDAGDLRADHAPVLGENLRVVSYGRRGGSGSEQSRRSDGFIDR